MIIKKQMEKHLTSMLKDEYPSNTWEVKLVEIGIAGNNIVEVYYFGRKLSMNEYFILLTSKSQFPPKRDTHEWLEEMLNHIVII